MSQPVCARRQTDEQVKPLLLDVFNANYRVHRRRKMRAALHREHGIHFDKDRIARLMREFGIRGVTRSKTTITTRSDRNSPRAGPGEPTLPGVASEPLGVCDFTYVPTWSGFAYTAFVIDVHSRMIVGWHTAATMTADLVKDALDMAIFSRLHQFVRGVIARSDRGVQSIRLGELHRTPRRKRRVRVDRQHRRFV
jgi:transposase InsO family protein